MAFLKLNSPTFFESLGIGCYTLSRQGTILRACNKQAKLLLGTVDLQQILGVINEEVHLVDHAMQSGALSYTVTSGDKTFQLLVYPPRTRKKLSTVLLVPITGSPRNLKSEYSQPEPEHDMVFLLDERYTIIEVKNQGKKGHLHVPSHIVLGKSLSSFLDSKKLEHWHLVFERAKETKARQSMFYRTSKRVGFRFLRVAIQWEPQRAVYRVWVDDISTPHLVAQGAHSGYLILDANSHIEYADAASIALLQKEPSAILGSDISTIFNPHRGGSCFDLQYTSSDAPHKVLRLTTFPSPHPEKQDHVIVQVCDITTQKDTPTKRGFVNLLLQLTYQLLQASYEELDEVLTTILQSLGEFCAADQVYIFQFDENALHMSCSHLWSAVTPAPSVAMLQHIPCEGYPNWYRALEEGQEVYVLSIRDLPDSWSAERQILADYGVTSILMEPISAGKKPLGFVGLDTKGRSLQWSEEMRGLLYVFANILGAFFARTQSEKRLNVALATADGLVKEREEVNRSLQAFYTKINHDTRNSLSAIHASCTLLKSTTMDATQCRYREAIESNSLFLLHLIRDIMDYSFLTTQPIVLAFQQTSLLDVVRNTIIAIHTLAEEKGLEVRLVWDESIPFTVMTDPVRLSQVLINLLHNAVKFTSKGTITVEGVLVDLTGAQAHVQLCVHDTGKGMDEDAVKNLSEAYGSTPMAHSGEGYGLGLGIVKQLAQAFGGTLHVQSCLGRGSSFTFDIAFALPNGVVGNQTVPLPLNVLVIGEPFPAVSALLSHLRRHQVQIVQRGSLPDSRLDATQVVLLSSTLLQTERDMQTLAAWSQTARILLYAPSFDRKRHELHRSVRPIQGYLLASQSREYCLGELLAKRSFGDSLPKQPAETGRMCVLVVDDSVINQEILRHHLQALQVDVLTALSGKQALSLLQECSVDLVLTDLQLPDLDGIAMTEHIRTFTEVRKRTVPVVLVSAFISEETRQRCQAVSIRECLTKPVQRDDVAILVATYRGFCS